MSVNTYIQGEVAKVLYSAIRLMNTNGFDSVAEDVIYEVSIWRDKSLAPIDGQNILASYWDVTGTYTEFAVIYYGLPLSREGTKTWRFSQGDNQEFTSSFKWIFYYPHNCTPTKKIDTTVLESTVCKINEIGEHYGFNLGEAIDFLAAFYIANVDKIMSEDWSDIKDLEYNKDE